MKHWPKLATLAWLVLAAPAAAAPTVTEFEIPTASSQPQDIVLGPDGKLWFTERVANKIGRLTPGNPPLIEDFAVPSGLTEPFNITVGPDNKLWFSGKVGMEGAVARMNPANPADTKEFHGFGVTTPNGITKGPDNAIWLGDNAGKVVRVDAATGTELASSDIPLGGAFGTRNLTPGPDGNVWVTSFGAGEVAKVTPGGIVTRYPVTGNSLWDIVLGPDNNLWYTVPDGNRIGKVATGGTFVDFPVTAGGDQFGIAVGPDGALWFAEAVANKIGRVTTDGQFSEVDGLTPAARPEYIAQGPNDTLWFTEKDGNRIGRITGIELPQQGGSPSRSRHRTPLVPTSPASGSPARASAWAGAGRSSSGASRRAAR
jgi:virginiamycin B lyase